nr:SDR family oxidoreductase [Microbispora rosea]
MCTRASTSAWRSSPSIPRRDARRSRGRSIRFGEFTGQGPDRATPLAAVVYAATKAALTSLTRTWAAEFGPSGVRVNIVAPGPTLTASVPEESASAVGATTLLHRHAVPREIAAAVVFLASAQASYLTGATIPVDGGRTIA